jgi:hypothetical protein
MKRSAGCYWLAALIVLVGVSGAGTTEAASIKLRYGFKQGAAYRVTEQNHDVGKSVTEMNVMGQQQKIETPSDRVSSGTWTAKVVGKEGGVVIVHPVDGAVKIVASPAGDQMVDIIYQGRFGWMPELPEGSLKVGGEFTHEYVMKSGMYNVKATDEYYLAEIKGGFATFDVESKQLVVIKMDKGPGGTGAMQGMTIADMKLAYKGDGTAVFDLKEGIFIEREGKMSYSNLDSGTGNTMGMAFSTKMTGTSKFRWEMERE